ncbi:MAG: hypothetical protein QM695_16165 [Micropruina sp.]
MGLRYSLLVYSDDGALDLTRPRSGGEADAVMRRLFPRTPYRRVQTQPLPTSCFPPRDRPALAVFDGGVLIATQDAHLYDPGILNRRYLKLTEWPDLRLLTSRSSNNMFGYGRWREGALARCLSVNATAAVWRNHGTPEPFEGSAPVSEQRWLDLSNAALASILRLDGDAGPTVPNAVPWEAVALHVFARADRG